MSPSSRACVVLIAFLAASPVALAMNNYDDPRTILSYMDPSLAGARDILRVTTAIAGDEFVVFQVKTREEGAGSGEGDYALLQLWQDRSHQLLIPLAPELGEGVLYYEGATLSAGASHTLTGGELGAASGASAFTARRIPRGVEFVVPLAWLDYGKKMGFDAYTVRGRPVGDGFVIEEVLDRAAKGRPEERLISPIMLLNNLCATRR